MKQLLVTGGGGFLGKEITRQLIAKYKKEYQILCVGRNIYPEVEELGASCIRVDLTDKKAVADLDLSEVRAIFHVAALAGVWGKYDDYYRINYLGTKYIIDHARDQGVKFFIHTSTPSVVFGKDDIINGDESIPFAANYLNAYTETKALAERYVHTLNSSDFFTVALRPHLIWGSGDPHLIPRVIARAREQKLKRVGDGENQVDIIHVENAALAHVLAFESLNKGSDIGGRSYFIGQERPVFLWEFINQILAMKHINPVESSVSFSVAYFMGGFLESIYKLLGIYKPEPPMTRFVALQLAKSHYFSHARARSDFGYTPRISIEEGLEKAFKTSLS